MQNAASDASIQSGGRNGSHDAIVSDLTLLVAQVRASMELIEAAIAREASPGIQEVSADVVVLDDITPRYVNANVALNSCRAGLGVALHFLMDTKATKPEMDNLVEFGRPIRSTSRA
jgi:hypothetical protein